MSIANAAAFVRTQPNWATTIGQICDEWDGEVQTGPFGSQLHASDYEDDGTPVVMPQDMKDGKIVCDRIVRVGSDHVSRLNRHQLRPGDIVFSRRGDVTRFAVVTEVEAGWLCGTGSMRIRLNSPEIDVGFVRRYLQQEAVGKWLTHHAKGVTMPNLNTKIVRDLPFIYPPLPEQRRIAEVLDRADALRAKRRAALAQLDELTQSLFLDMFGDPVTNPKKLRKASLGELIKLKSGEFLPASGMAEAGPYPVFGGNGINGYHDQFMFETPQVIIGRVGVYCGCVHVSPPRSWVTDNALYVNERGPDVDVEYLACQHVAFEVQGATDPCGSVEVLPC